MWVGWFISLSSLSAFQPASTFFDRCNLIFKQAIRFKHPISVIMMDIDHFKNINDNHGHSVGDKTLKIIADLLKNMAREIDVVARIGGEEFAFVLPETGLDEAVNLAERLRLEIEKTNVTHHEKTLHITASFGIASSPAGNETLESMLTKSDDALYIAKKKGRNQVKAGY